MSGSSKRRVVVVLGMIVGIPLLGAAVFTGLVVLGPTFDSYRHQLSFDAEAWRAGLRDDGVMWPTRLRMADDLVRAKRLSGLSRPEVERLLGTPDTTAKFRNWDLVYHLGPERGLIRIDSEWLVVRLTPDQRVSEYRLVRD